MIRQLRANVAAHLRFFRRNRLLFAIALVFMLFSSIYAGMAILFESAAGRFELVRTLFIQLCGYSMIFVAALGLVLMSTHLRGRAVKLVFSKPCSVEMWVGSAFVAAIFLAAALFGTIWLLGVVLSLIWQISIQPGLAFIAIEMFARAVILMALLTFLSTVFHPILALMLVVFFNEQIFHGLRMGLMTAIRGTGGNPLLPVLEKLTHWIYMILPMQDPLGDLSAEVWSSLRVAGPEWGYLAMLIVYAIAATLIFYYLSVRMVYRRNLM